MKATISRFKQKVWPHLLVFLPLVWIPVGSVAGQLANRNNWMEARPFCNLLLVSIGLGILFSCYRLWKIQGTSKILTALVYVGVFIPLQFVAYFLVGLSTYGK